MATPAAAGPDTLVNIKVVIDGNTRRFKLALRDLGASSLENKIRGTLDVPAAEKCLFERYSDSAGAYVVLDPNNVSVYKQLYRAAKAKQKLKLRVTTLYDATQGRAKEEPKGPKPVSVEDEPEAPEAPQPATVDKAEQPLISLSPLSTPKPLRDLEDALDRLESTMNQTKASEQTKREQHQKITRNLDMLEASVNALQSNVMSDFGSFGRAVYSYGQGCEIKQTPAFPFRTSCTFARPHVASSTRAPAPTAGIYAVCCNICDKTIPGAHYHCSTCDDGDFDLCQECVDRGETCNGADHWLIKRFVKDGAFINSTTERIAPKPKVRARSRDSLVASSQRVVPVMQNFLFHNIRTCNSCVAEASEAEFVHCTTCDDFDLCKACFTADNHGHHPKHGFVAAVPGAILDPEISRRLAPGRNATHSAICDGCDKAIRGIRHKCLDCPDWDYCNNCIIDASFVHANHRFVPIYEQIESMNLLRSRSVNRAFHAGICCDGPLCQTGSKGFASTYIVGDRYKCAVCHDTDFCASCEASPANTHNKTHPLIKFKTPVKYVSVTTSGAQGDGTPITALGDQNEPSRASTNTLDVSPFANEVTAPIKEDIVKTDVLFVADVEPSSASAPAPVDEDKAGIADAPVPAPTSEKPLTATDLVAVYSHDTVTDGTVMPPSHTFEQTWFLRNAGTVAWPAGCSVKFVGGDYMGHLDTNRPAGVGELISSSISTVCEHTVAPGEEVAFSVVLRTPAREGKVISYWRLTTKDGMKFGHRLWCDINVLNSEYKDEPEVKKELVEETPAEETKAEETKVEASESSSIKTQESLMIFPKLEKESPVASVHEEIQPDAPPAYEEEYEDCNEDDEWAREDSDSGFLTDEEYDVLDASDEEYLEEQQKKFSKK